MNHPLTQPLHRCCLGVEKLLWCAQLLYWQLFQTFCTTNSNSILIFLYKLEDNVGFVPERWRSGKIYSFHIFTIPATEIGNFVSSYVQRRGL